MRTSAASEHRLDRLIGRRQLLNWRWWVALLPVVLALVVLHTLAVIGDGLSDACEWFGFRCWRMHYQSLQAAKRCVTQCHAWVFHAAPNTQSTPK